MKPAPAPALLLLAALLASCSTHTPPAPVPVLSFERLDATTTRATLTPAPALSLRWTVEPSPDCGNHEKRGDTSAGSWPALSPSVTVRAWRGLLFTVSGDGWQASDCVPSLNWNTPQSIPIH